MIWSLFAWLGLYTFVYYLYDILKSPIQLGYHKWLEYNGKSISLSEKYGKWAAVTGSTDGIGKAYAKELARRGLNIMLISRNPTKLNQVALEIENEFGVETFIVQTDFSKGPHVYEHLFQELGKRPIGILVNNVGIGPNPPGTVSTFSHDHICDMIKVNIGAATLLSRHIIDKWLRSGIKGCIVNISSGLELYPIPYTSVYGASKAFIRSFTLALQHEVEQFGIKVQLVSPWFVVTNINKYSSFVMRGNIFVPHAEKYAKWAVSSMDKISATTGYYWHGIQSTIWSTIPWRLRSILIIWITKWIVDDSSNILSLKEITIIPQE